MLIDYVITGSGNFEDVYSFKLTHPDVEIIAIDNRICIAQCDVCSNAILEPDMSHGHDCDICESCFTNMVQD